MNPSLLDFASAHRVIRQSIPATPLTRLDSLGERFECRLYAKHENLNAGRSFKIRGALYRLSLLDANQRRAGIATCSTGNHAIGVAFAAKKFDVSALIVVPIDAPPVKVDQALRYGADVRRIGSDLVEANAVARDIAAQEGMLFIEDGDDRGLMIGAGTISLEIILDLPQVEVILIPTGGGNLLAGMALCAKLLHPRIRVVGVQSEAAPSVYESWKAGRLVRAPSHTFAGGLATDRPGRVAFDTLATSIDDILLVSEDDLRRAMMTAVDAIGQTVEGAGAAGLAAIDRYRELWRGQEVATVLTGGNVDSGELYMHQQHLRRDFSPNVTA